MFDRVWPIKNVEYAFLDCFIKSAHTNDFQDKLFEDRLIHFCMSLPRVKEKKQEIQSIISDVFQLLCLSQKKPTILTWA